MASFNDYIADNPTGLKLCYCVRIRGLPYQWTTGEGDWSGANVWGSSGEVNGEFDVTTKHAGLAGADFEFNSKLSATNPVDPGSGVSFDLLDDETGYLRQMLAPRHGSETRQTQAFNSLDGATSGFHPMLGSNHKIYMVAPGTFTTTSDI